MSSAIALTNFGSNRRARADHARARRAVRVARAWRVACMRELLKWFGEG